MSKPEQHEMFPATSWTLVARASIESADGRSLSELIERYLPAMRSFVVRVMRVSESDADDIVQGFVTTRLLEKNILHAASQHRGRLRAYLSTAIRNYVIDRQRGVRAWKDIESHPELLADPGDQDHGFDAEWARALLDRTASRLRDHFITTGKPKIWEVFKARVLVPTRDGVPAPDYEQLVSRFGFRTATEACSAVTTGKRAFSRLLRSALRETVDRDEDVDDELRILRDILSEQK